MEFRLRSYSLKCLVLDLFHKHWVLSPFYEDVRGQLDMDESYQFFWAEKMGSIALIERAIDDEIQDRKSEFSSFS